MLKVKNLQKAYGNVEILKDVNFEVFAGEIVGFVGRNGSGKTTTMRSILGLIRFDSGVIELNGNPISIKNLKNIGYMPEERGLYAKQPVYDQIKFFAQLQGITSDEISRIIPSTLDQFELTSKRNELLGKLSLGNQQRIQYIISIAHDPQLLILDEPFSGLDPMAANVMIAHLKRMASHGKAILFSSHQLGLVSEICDRIVILDCGRIVANDSVENLQKLPKATFCIQSKKIPKSWSESRFFTEISRTENQVTVEFERSDYEGKIAHILTEALSYGAVSGFFELKPSLNEIYENLISA